METTEIGSKEKRMLEYNDRMIKNLLSNEQKLAKEYIPINHAKEMRMKAIMVHKKFNKVFVHDYYISWKRKLYNEFSEEQIEREIEAWQEFYINNK